MPLITRWFGANTVQVISARLSSDLPRWTPASEVLFPRCTSTSLCWWSRGWSGFWCRFCTLVLIVPESTRNEYLNIIISKSDSEWTSVIKNGIMSASNPEEVVDHVSDLSSAKEPIFFLSFLFLQTDFLLEVRILDDLVQSRRNPRIQHLKFRETSITQT